MQRICIFSISLVAYFADAGKAECVARTARGAKTGARMDLLTATTKKWRTHITVPSGEVERGEDTGGVPRRPAERRRLLLPGLLRHHLRPVLRRPEGSCRRCCSHADVAAAASEMPGHTGRKASVQSTAEGQRRNRATQVKMMRHDAPAPQYMMMRLTPWPCNADARLLCVKKRFMQL